MNKTANGGIETDIMTTPNTQMISLPDPRDKMGFDGERFVSGVSGEIAHEHYLRYLFAMQFCVGKDVLDVASGEGYGSSLLGQVAATAHGTDLSSEAVAFANEHYRSATVSFSQGDVRDIPHPAAAFDVVVSFETLEHIDEHERFIEEIKRVLRPNGLLVMSSPNRDVYLRGLPPNPFHRREPNRGEFEALLAQSFRHHRVGQQRSLTGAVLFPEGPLQGERLDTFSKKGTSVELSNSAASATYLVAIASDAPLPEIIWAALADADYLPDLRQSYEDDVKRLSAQADYMQDEQIVYKSEITRLNADVASLQQEVRRLTEMLDVQNADAERSCQEQLGKQRTKLLTDVLEIFS